MKIDEILKIDKDNLDIEWGRQPRLFQEWSEKLANAIYERDKKKQELEELKAELDSDIRKNPSSYGLDKVTESAISSTIVRNEKYKEKYDEVIDAVKRVNILTGIRDALEHKKSALKHLTNLFLANYYGTNMSVELGDTVNEVIREGQIKRLGENKRLKKIKN